MKKIIIFLFSFLFTGISANANVVLHEGEFEGKYKCGIKGPITVNDPEYLELIVKSMGCDSLQVSSPGGDVRAAIKIGTFVRSQNMNVIVPDGGECASACVFIYAGGVIRAPYGPIKIHRPYLESSKATFADTQAQYDIIANEIKAYLRSVNVSESLFDRMIKIAPEVSISLTLEELENYGLGFRDPVYLEYIDNKRAASAGMTKKDWLLKKQKTKRVCGDIQAPVDTSETESRKACWDKEFPEFFSN